ncbi:hypothetical protein [Fodinicurvata sediminis]|uniref:hypothetical protein n=1 Tax=Fodinicurvata sediminis TaxID=1121832 RepID=UPI0003B55AF3|nr:hypothetical protein [Fodinicurvata sediminis]
MAEPSLCRVVGRWRITGSDIWDRDFLDLVEPARLSLDNAGQGEIVFGAFQASLDIQYGKSIVFFHWAGFDEGDEVWGDGSAELLDDGSLEIELNRVDGDEAILTAVRETTPAA